jgi:hypothetical protein
VRVGPDGAVAGSVAGALWRVVIAKKLMDIANVGKGCSAPTRPGVDSLVA